MSALSCCGCSERTFTANISSKSSIVVSSIVADLDMPALASRDLETEVGAPLFIRGARDQMMAKHKANHIQVAYAHSAGEADTSLEAKAALASELGLRVFLCGTDAQGKPLGSKTGV